MSAEFVSEQIEPVKDTDWFGEVAVGEPLLPRRFVWREQEYVIARVVETWKQLGACWSGGSDKYLRKHFYRLETTSGDEMVVYFRRKPFSQAQSKQRWWLYSFRRTEPGASGQQQRRS